MNINILNDFKLILYKNLINIIFNSIYVNYIYKITYIYLLILLYLKKINYFEEFLFILLIFLLKYLSIFF